MTLSVNKFSRPTSFLQNIDIANKVLEKITCRPILTTQLSTIYADCR